MSIWDYNSPEHLCVYVCACQGSDWAKIKMNCAHYQPGLLCLFPAVAMNYLPNCCGGKSHHTAVIFHSFHFNLLWKNVSIMSGMKLSDKTESQDQYLRLIVVTWKAQKSACGSSFFSRPIGDTLMENPVKQIANDSVLVLLHFWLIQVELCFHFLFFTL